MDMHRELSDFEQLSTETREELLRRDDFSPGWVQRAVDTAADRLASLQSLSQEEGARAARSIKRDLASTRSNFGRARDVIQLSVDPSRVGGGFTDLAAHLFGRAGDQFQEWAARSEEALEFSTGEVTGPGTLTCTECGTELHLKRPSHIPPCPKCHKTDFRKSY